MPDLAIDIGGAVKRYGPITAVDSLELAVEPGVCFGLLGPNGAGKSATMRMPTAQTLADAGEIIAAGVAAKFNPLYHCVSSSATPRWAGWRQPIWRTPAARVLPADVAPGDLAPAETADRLEPERVADPVAAICGAQRSPAGTLLVRRVVGGACVEA
ncbi:MAG TPA: ATP-binding cassette domain-containing protein [Solirubrobacteraceae bacterium]|jgi:ABC-type cobalamin/Fe3+-siderophores transport system ATPase subunit